jgi:hypothetical protein
MESEKPCDYAGRSNCRPEIILHIWFFCLNCLGEDAIYYNRLILVFQVDGTDPSCLEFPGNKLMRRFTD